MNQSQNDTKEERENTMGNHQPDTLERQLEQWVGEAEREPTECIKTEETTKGHNKQSNAQEKEENKQNNEKTTQEQHEPDELEQLLGKFTDETEAEKEEAEKEECRQRDQQEQQAKERGKIAKKQQQETT